jgi:hypothetical protein
MDPAESATILALPGVAEDMEGLNETSDQQVTGAA